MSLQGYSLLHIRASISTRRLSLLHMGLQQMHPHPFPPVDAPCFSTSRHPLLLHFHVVTPHFTSSTHSELHSRCIAGGGCENDNNGLNDLVIMLSRRKYSGLEGYNGVKRNNKGNNNNNKGKCNSPIFSTKLNIIMSYNRAINIYVTNFVKEHV